MFDSHQCDSGSKTKTEPTRKSGASRPSGFHTQSLVLSLCGLPCASICRTRPSSTSRQQARLRPRTSSRRQPSRRPPSRALPKLTAPPEPQGPPPAGVYNTGRIRGHPTRNRALGPLGLPQALGCCSQNTRLVRGIIQRVEGGFCFCNVIIIKLFSKLIPF